MTDARPSPDALLEQAERESRGRLKIFLGAAPGVGKTYEMLQAAQRKRAEGVDVVVDQYPYNRSSTNLGITLPSWALADGDTKVKERLSDSSTKRASISSWLSISLPVCRNPST